MLLSISVTKLFIVIGCNAGTWPPN